MKTTTEYRCTCGAHLEMRRVDAGLFAQCKRCGRETLVGCGGPHYSPAFESQRMVREPARSRPSRTTLL